MLERPKLPMVEKKGPLLAPLQQWFNNGTFDMKPKWSCEKYIQHGTAKMLVQKLTADENAWWRQITGADHLQGHLLFEVGLWCNMPAALHGGCS